ncbi:MAG TPA: hypothetical protein VGC54_09070 [Planctomycetota bacterium]
MRAAGFTILELLFLIAALSAVSALAIPQAMKPRLRHNEEVAADYLAMIRTAQQYWLETESTRGTLSQLCSGIELLPLAFQPGLDGVVQRGGYRFREGFFADVTPGEDLAPAGCWAWPTLWGYSGGQVLWLDYTSGEIHEVDASYSGKGEPPLTPPSATGLGPVISR